MPTKVIAVQTRSISPKKPADIGHIAEFRETWRYLVTGFKSKGILFVLDIIDYLLSSEEPEMSPAIIEPVYLEPLKVEAPKPKPLPEMERFDLPSAPSILHYEWMVTHFDPVGIPYVSLPGGDNIPLGGKGYKDNQPHFVNLRPFEIAQILVTREAYLTVTGRSPSSSIFGTEQAENDDSRLPVDSVCMSCSATYAKALSLLIPDLSPALWGKINNMSPVEYLDFVVKNRGNGLYRLPTDSEWEYALRGGTTRKFFWGDNVDDIHRYAWTDIDDDAGKMTHVVGLKAPNPFGLYDMLGNLGEWVHRNAKRPVWREGKTYDNPALELNTSDLEMVGARGGSFKNKSPGFFLSAFRYYSKASYDDPAMGIRLVRD